MPFDPTFLIRSLFSLPVIGDLWWFWLFGVLFFVTRSVWLSYIQEYYIRTTKYIVLEMQIPREAKRPPRAMDQIFMSLHSIRNSASDFKEQWWDGEVPYTFSCEAVSFGGDIHFYMRVPAIRRNHVEAAIYASYPDVEIREIEDYVSRLPSTIKELEGKGYKLFGNELVLANKDIYPIMTYADFEANIEEKELDPVSALIETLSRIRPTEHLWMQILVRPLVDDYITAWHKKGEDEIKAIQERTGKRKMFSPAFGEFVMIDRAPGDVEMMKQVDRTIAKPGFDVVIRYLYVSPKETFSPTYGRRSIFLVMNQYANETYNKFRHNTAAWTLAKVWYFPFIFPKSRAYARRRRIYKNYRERMQYPYRFMSVVLKMWLFDWGWRAWRASANTIVLNTEELATIYHLPTSVVLTGPLIKRVESRRIGPPAGLPIYGEGGEDLPIS